MREPLAPETLINSGRYRVRRVIGRGGMSTVYEVDDLRLSGRWALKELQVISEDQEEQKIIQAQFRKEAEILSQLTHPVLVKVVDYFIEDGREFLVEDYVEGRDLLSLFEENRDFREDEVVNWAVQICDCLIYIHGKAIVYRDLKPSNVLITDDGSVKLLDFGIARMYQAGKAQDTIIMGTPGFSPPEQYGKSQTDARSDIFSLGATMHFLLSRRDPGSNPFVFPPICSLNDRISRRTEAAISKAVNTSPDERWAGAREFKEALLAREEPVLQDQVFDYGRAHPYSATYAAAGALIAGVDILLMAINPVWAVDMLLLGILPFASAAPALLYRELKRRADVRIIVKESGITYFEKGQRVRASWDDVESLAFRVKKEHQGVHVVSDVEVRTRQGKFSYDTSAAPPGSISMALQRHHQLTELIIRKAALKQKSPGSSIYVKIGRED
jgi:serine/threonine protein kinase